jgi:hypothetical protein
MSSASTMPGGMRAGIESIGMRGAASQKAAS